MQSLAEKHDQIDENICRIVSVCLDRVKQDYPDARIILYGSQAAGRADQYSDIDVIVLLPGSVSSPQKNSVHDLLYEIGLENNVVISAFIRSEQQWEGSLSRASLLYKSVQSEGILVK